MKDRGDGTYDIDYDDGESETRVSKDLIKVNTQPTNSGQPCPYILSNHYRTRTHTLSHTLDCPLSHSPNPIVYTIKHTIDYPHTHRFLTHPSPLSLLTLPSPPLLTLPFSPSQWTLVQVSESSKRRKRPDDEGKGDDDDSEVDLKLDQKVEVHTITS